MSLLALDQFIYSFEGLIEGCDELTVFVGRVVHELLGEDVCDVFADLETWVGVKVPPWPSKTAKRLLPSPMLQVWMAASSMLFLQPEWGDGYLAFRRRRRRRPGTRLS